MQGDLTVMPKPARRLPWTTLLMLYLLLLGYGSLLPFEGSSELVVWQAWDSWFDGLYWLVSQPDWGMWRRVDVYANVVLYVPAGVFALFVFRGRLPWGWLGAWIGAVLLLGVFSYGMESCQVLVTDRVASLNDVVCNAMGGAIGATVSLVFRSFAIGVAFVGTVWYRRVARHVVGTVGPAGGWRAAGGLLLVGLAGWLMWRYLGHWSAMERPDVVELNWWPMGWHYVLSYDKALVLLIRATLTYAMVSGLLWVAWHVWRGSGSGSWTLLPVVWLGLGMLLGWGVEMWRVMSGRTAGDVTEGLTAAAGVGMFVLVVVMWRRGFVRGDRRRADVAVAVDRREVWG